MFIELSTHLGRCVNHAKIMIFSISRIHSCIFISCPSLEHSIFPFFPFLIQIFPIFAPAFRPKSDWQTYCWIRYRILWLRFRNQNVDQTLKQPRTMDTPVWRTRYLKCSLQGWSWSTTRFLGHGWFRVRPIFQHTIQKRLDLKSRPNKWTI